MATKKRKANQKKVATMQKRLSVVRAKNSKLGNKKPYDGDGMNLLLEAVAIAMELPIMPKEIQHNAESMRLWCIMNNAPSVQRDAVCRKVSNYRADSAIASRLVSAKENGIIAKSVSYVWGVNNAYAVRNPFTVESERVFIVRK